MSQTKFERSLLLQENSLKDLKCSHCQIICTFLKSMIRSATKHDRKSCQARLEIAVRERVHVLLCSHRHLFYTFWVCHFSKACQKFRYRRLYTSLAFVKRGSDSVHAWWNFWQFLSHAVSEHRKRLLNSGHCTRVQYPNFLFSFERPTFAFQLEPFYIELVCTKYGAPCEQKEKRTAQFCLFVTFYVTIKADNLGWTLILYISVFCAQHSSFALRPFNFLYSVLGSSFSFLCALADIIPVILHGSLYLDFEVRWSWAFPLTPAYAKFLSFLCVYMYMCAICVHLDQEDFWTQMTRSRWIQNRLFCNQRACAVDTRHHSL